MIVEKMLELLLLHSYLIDFCFEEYPENFESFEYDRDKMVKRYSELLKEFFEPYVIAKTRKSN